VPSRLVSFAFALSILAACSGGATPSAPPTNPFSTTVFVIDGGSPGVDLLVSLNQGTNSIGRELPILQTGLTDGTGHVTFYNCHPQPYPQEATISIP
jgi:hypothetical protein